MIIRRSTLLASLCGLAWMLVLCGAPAALAAAKECPNEEFRIGRSATLPDCRAYELVTPAELGRTADLAFEGQDHAIASTEGQAVALLAQGSYLEPDPFIDGTLGVFERTPEAWQLRSAVTPELVDHGLDLELWSPDLTQVVIEASGEEESSTATVVTGRVGGPYSTIGTFPHDGGGTDVLGGNAGTKSVAPLSDVVFQTESVALPPGSAERKRAEKETQPGYQNLYEWSGGGDCKLPASSCKLVNVNDKGELLNRCGADLGKGYEQGQSHNAVSDDGSKAFFVSPETEHNSCHQEPQLYMRVDGSETVDVSVPQDLEVPLSERGPVEYAGAAGDGSKVFFKTGTALTPEAVGQLPMHLYEYDTEAPEGHRLTLVANGVSNYFRISPAVDVSEDGSTVYYRAERPVPGVKELELNGIFRYDTLTGSTSFVAVPHETESASEPDYVSPNGEFLIFPSKLGAVEVLGPDGLEPELRGEEHEELYRYDAATGSVMCVTCGEGVAPAKGHETQSGSFFGLLVSSDGLQTPPSISDDGRRVFFQTSAKLVPQDANESTAAEEAGGVLGIGADVYEWEEQGTEEAPGVVCEVANGCTHLISAGEAVGGERFLGASTSGDDVFFISAAQLVSWATPEFTNIYDARVDGGLSPPKRALECLSCQGVGSPPLTFSTPASLTFVGAGNPPPPVNEPSSPPGKRKCANGRRLRHGRCVRTRAKKGKRATRSTFKSHARHESGQALKGGRR